MTQSDQHGEYDGRVDEIPYEQARDILLAESRRLTEIAMEQLRKNYIKKGDGWQFESPRWHFWKGQDELFSACHALKNSDLETKDKRVGDGWNHILMGSHLAYSDEDESERVSNGALPFRCEWEIGIQETGDPDEWEHYHPLARSEAEARKQAREDAKHDGYQDPYVLNVFGPMKPRNAERVGEEMIQSVFGETKV